MCAVFPNVLLALKPAFVPRMYLPDRVSLHSPATPRAIGKFNSQLATATTFCFYYSAVTQERRFHDKLSPLSAVK